MRLSKDLMDMKMGMIPEYGRIKGNRSKNWPCKINLVFDLTVIKLKVF